jgi:hypothetical protein
MGRLTAVCFVVIAGLGGLAGAGGAAAATSSPTGACATSGSYTGTYVAVVVEHGDGATLSRCVRLSGTTMTGERVLAASGLEYQTQSYSFGDALCQLDHEPAAYTACLPSTGSYWALFVWSAGGPWQAASQGISAQTFTAGEAMGLRYDPESATTPPPPGATPPPACTAALGCREAASTAAPSGGASGGVSIALIVGLAALAVLLALAATQVVLRRRRT